MRRLRWPSLQQQSWAHFTWNGSVGIQKNWVPLQLSDTSVLFSHSLEPHVVLRCALPSAGMPTEVAAAASMAAASMAAASHSVYNRTVTTSSGNVVHIAAERLASPQSTCTEVHRTSATEVGYPHRGLLCVLVASMQPGPFARNSMLNQHATSS